MVTADPAVRDQWGTVWDATVAVVEQAIAGNSPINLTGNTFLWLSVANNAPDQARSFVLNFTGSLTAVCAIGLPAVAKFGLVMNNTTGGQVLVLGTPSGYGTGATGRLITVQPGQSTFFNCDGVNVDTPNIVSSTPVGALMNYAGATAPPHWLMCNGQLVSRTTYALLFAVIGTTYGAGDGLATFGLPDLRGRTMAGLDNMGGAAAAGRMTANSGTPGTTLGGVGGNEMLQSHAHGVYDPQHTHTINDPGHAHSVYDPTHNHGVNDPQHVHGVGDPTHAHSIADGGHNHSHNDPTHIHQLFDYGHAHAGSTDAQGNHNHNFYAPNMTGAGNFIGGNSSHQITDNQNWLTDVQGNHAHNIGTDVRGTGIYLGYSATGVTNNPSGTGIGIYGAYTGIYLGYAYTGVSIQYHATGVSIYAAGVGTYNSYSPTGIGIYGTGSGSTQNMPPVMMVSTIIYTGV
jgi:microcystin-dependent protein